MLKYVKNISKVMLYIVVLVTLVYWGGGGVYKLNNDVLCYL